MRDHYGDEFEAAGITKLKIRSLLTCRATVSYTHLDVYKRQDKNRKLPVTVLCRALGLSTNEDILNFFGDDERILATLEKDTTKNQDCLLYTSRCV